MITVRHADERGHSRADWLDSRHTFSFADYHDPEHMGFRALRVINDDRVRPSSGFGTHGHRDMEILTYVLSGALSHKDSLGNGSAIRPGEMQRMSAGTGVRHSEWNDSADEPVRLLQIWILPDQEGLPPGYEQRRFEPSELRDRLRLVASPDGRDGSLRVHQDVAVYAARLSPSATVSYSGGVGRYVWVQTATGSVSVNSVHLGEGDGAAISDEPHLVLRATGEAEVLLFDLA